MLTSLVGTLWVLEVEIDDLTCLSRCLSPVWSLPSSHSRMSHEGRGAYTRGSAERCRHPGSIPVGAAVQRPKLFGGQDSPQDLQGAHTHRSQLGNSRRFCIQMLDTLHCDSKDRPRIQAGKCNETLMPK